MHLVLVALSLTILAMFFPQCVRNALFFVNGGKFALKMIKNDQKMIKKWSKMIKKCAKVVVGIQNKALRTHRGLDIATLLTPLRHQLHPILFIHPPAYFNFRHFASIFLIPLFVRNGQHFPTFFSEIYSFSIKKNII